MEQNMKSLVVYVVVSRWVCARTYRGFGAEYLENVWRWRLGCNKRHKWHIANGMVTWSMA